jgi:hypothetical protein
MPVPFYTRTALLPVPQEAGQPAAKEVEGGGAAGVDSGLPGVIATSPTRQP